jgi:flagellar biogenesis protein FliO
VRRLIACGVIVLATSASSLTRAAPPDPAPSADALSAPSAPGAALGVPLSPADALPAPSAPTPLQMRPGKPLSLEPAPAHSSLLWKLLAMAVVIAGGLFVWKRRTGPLAASPSVQMNIVRRVPVGVRSELLIIEVEGQRMLLGVTPHGIQNLYIVPDTDAEEVGGALSAPGRTVADAIAASDEVRAATGGGASESKRSRRATASAGGSHDVIEAQARGLLSIGERR